MQINELVELNSVAFNLVVDTCPHYINEYSERLDINVAHAYVHSRYDIACRRLVHNGDSIANNLAPAISKLKTTMRDAYVH